jgi:hypothetical protein
MHTYGSKPTKTKFSKVVGDESSLNKSTYIVQQGDSKSIIDFFESWPILLLGLMPKDRAPIKRT